MITLQGAATLALRYEIEMVRYKLCWLPVKTTKQLLQTPPRQPEVKRRH